MLSSRFLDVEGDAACPGWTAQGRRIDVQFSCVGDGGLVTTMEDLAHWNGWLPASRLAELMLTGRPVLPNGRSAHDAWGISIRTHHGLKIQSHGGSIDGYMATFVRFPSVNVAIVMLANTDRFGVSDFGHRAQRLVDLLLGDNLDRSRRPWTQTHGQPPQD